MAQIALFCPTEDELADAREGLGRILDLDEIGEIDLPPYLTRLLLQLQDLLLVATPQPAGVAGARPSATLARR